MAREEAVQTQNPVSASVKTVEKEGGEPSMEPPWSSHVGSPPPPPPTIPIPVPQHSWLAGRHRAVCLSYLLLYIHDSWSSTPTLVKVRWCLQHVYTVWCLNRSRHPLPPWTLMNYLEWCPGSPPPLPPHPFFHLQSCKLWLPSDDPTLPPWPEGVGVRAQQWDSVCSNFYMQHCLPRFGKRASAVLTTVTKELLVSRFRFFDRCVCLVPFYKSSV